MRNDDRTLKAAAAALLFGLGGWALAAPESPPGRGEPPRQAAPREGSPRGEPREARQDRERAPFRAGPPAAQPPAPPPPVPAPSPSPSPSRDGRHFSAGPDSPSAQRPPAHPAPRPDYRPGPRPDPRPDHRPAPRPGDTRWWDGAHGHARYYPAPGVAVHVAPPRARVVVWAGISYRYFDGVWYSPGAGGYLVVRPPIGIVVSELPVFRTVVTLGPLTYYYVNGAYYRERYEGGYEVVPAPADAGGGVTTSTSPERVFVYPSQGQSAQQQANDEYECHRWAMAQTGYDPTAAAVGQASVETTRRSDYRRALGACLEGRGYTVR